MNEQHILSFKLDILTAREDREGVKQAFLEYKDFLVCHAAKTGENLSDEIEKVNEIIKDLEEYHETPRINANA